MDVSKVIPGFCIAADREIVNTLLVEPFTKSSCNDVALPKVAFKKVGFELLNLSGDATVRLMVWLVATEAVSVPVRVNV